MGDETLQRPADPNSKRIAAQLGLVDQRNGGGAGGGHRRRQTGIDIGCALVARARGVTLAAPAVRSVETRRGHEFTRHVVERADPCLQRDGGDGRDDELGDADIARHLDLAARTRLRDHDDRRPAVEGALALADPAHQAEPVFRCLFLIVPVGDDHAGQALVHHGQGAVGTARDQHILRAGLAHQRDQDGAQERVGLQQERPSPGGRRGRFARRHVDAENIVGCSVHAPGLSNSVLPSRKTNRLTGD